MDGYALVAFALAGFLVIGVLVGLMLYHFNLGFFLSVIDPETIEYALSVATARSARRVKRRYRRQVAGRHAAGGSDSPAGDR
jgi:hypothetical protein